jgi:hypothetical protein
MGADRGPFSFLHALHLAEKGAARPQFVLGWNVSLKKGQNLRRNRTMPLAGAGSQRLVKIVRHILNV